MLKVCTIGGGSSYTPELIEGFIKRYKSFPVDEIWLVDIEEGREKLEIVSDLARRMIKKAGLPIKIVDTLDRRAAIKGASFVTTQFRVGLLDARIKDEQIPLSHGCIGQETNGAGGLFKALRTIPVIFDIIKDIKELAPEAWLINFTNPVGIVTQAVAKYADFERFIGLCNIPYGTKVNVAKILDRDMDSFELRMAGLNHMVFGTSVKVDGKEVISDVIKNFSKAKTVKNIPDYPFDIDFIRELNLIPCGYHRYYYKYRKMLNEQLEDYENHDHKTRGTFVKQIEKELFELYKDPNLDVKPKQLEERGGAHYSDAACNLIDSIYNDRGDIQVVNTVNKGAINVFDYDETCEVSCKITKDGPIPCHIGDVPLPVRGLLRQIKTFELVASEAAYEKSINKAILALCINPLSEDDELSKQIVLELFEAHKKYLEGYTYVEPEE